VRFCGNVGSRERLGTFANVETLRGERPRADCRARVRAAGLATCAHSSPSHSALSFAPRSVLLPPFRRRFSKTSSFSEVNRQAQRLEGFADEFTAILSRQIDERR
jgi:hypothetical protein